MGKPYAGCRKTKDGTSRFNFVLNISLAKRKNFCHYIKGNNLFNVEI